MFKDKKVSGSRPKEEPKPEQTVIGATVQPSDDKEIKAALPTPFMGDRKETKKFMLEVQLYIALNLKAIKNDKLKELFMLSYIQRGAAQFWKSDKTETLLAEEDSAKISTWKNFLKDFKKLFEPLDVELDTQMKLCDLKMKDRANEYFYKFKYLANQTRYNNMAQIKAFKGGYSGASC
ncbi:hypothetical protein Moror_13489 [Moniliophthora roreri MCA 2997]|uniref:Retrotransposon gag domain-containing protein n=2 Tax=Moniliophthora roreri TaxID=221103 RepID=V2WAM8_MONRO|nr:hypothetical protein Moror_13489 [Moniliophthora roreri MCA 2997]